MGAFVSIQYCESHYNTKLNCSVNDEFGKSVTFNGTWPTNVSLGGYRKGEFPGDPDIGGIGVLGVFVAVTSFALAVSIIDVLWQGQKIYKRMNHKQEGNNKQKRVSFSDICETLVLACSDQQVFTGAAYSLTLRYWRGCSVSAYHYNIVANMLLLTCATHLLSVTIVRNYWKFPWLAILRILAISGVFIVTGLLFTNQNAEDHRFPTDIPARNETNSLIFLPAACFQSDGSTAASTFHDSVKDPNSFFDKTLANSTPDNKIHGWNLYIIILLFYGAAIIAEAIRFVRRGKSRKGWRGNIGNKLGRYCALGTVRRSLIQIIILLYLLLGVAIGSAIVVISTGYILNLRSWVHDSGWMQLEDDQNPENDATSFGQLVPILTSALIVFSFAQIISEKVTKHNNRKHEDEETPLQDGTIQYLDPSNYNLLSPPAQSPEKFTSEYFGAAGVYTVNSPPRPGLEHQSSWGSAISVPNTRPEAVKLYSPMLVASEPSATTPPAKNIAYSPSIPPQIRGYGYNIVPTDHD